MNGLSAYHDESDPEDAPSFSNLSLNAGRRTQNETSTSTRPDVPPDARKARPPRPPVIIKRPARVLAHPRVHEDDLAPASSSETMETDAAPASDPPDEMAHIRALLRPPPIPGATDWGIPPEPTGPPGTEIQAKVAQFHALKRDATHPKHFNDSLMSNRSFRNPHLYAKLVEFVDVDERVTNFPRAVWDPADVQDDWFADRIADYQKAQSERQSQASSKRARIDFAPSSSSSKGAAASSSSTARYNKDAGPSAKYGSHGTVLGGQGEARGKKKTRWG